MASQIAIAGGKKAAIRLFVVRFERRSGLIVVRLGWFARHLGGGHVELGLSLLATRHPRALPQVDQVAQHESNALANRQLTIVRDSLHALQIAVHLGRVARRVQLLARRGEQTAQALEVRGRLVGGGGVLEQTLDVCVNRGLGEHVDIEQLADEANVADGAALGFFSGRKVAIVVEFLFTASEQIIAKCRDILAAGLAQLGVERGERVLVAGVLDNHVDARVEALLARHHHQCLLITGELSCELLEIGARELVEDKAHRALRQLELVVHQA